MSNNRNILFISPNFPPQKGIGSQRPIAFAKHLKLNGYNPIVFTVAEEDIKNTYGNLDRNRLKEIEELDIQIIRCATGKNYKQIARLMKLKIFRFFWLFNFGKYWDSYAKWPKNAIDEVQRIILENNISIVYTCNGPHSTLELGKLIKKNTNCTWIADIRDPLAEHFNPVWPSYFHWLWVKKKEIRLLNKADHLIVVTSEMRDIFLKKLSISKDKITVITNGF